MLSTRGARIPSSDPLQAIRNLSTSTVPRRQHLLWSGNNLDHTSNKLTKLPREWLDNLGVSQDVDKGISWKNLCSSTTHSLLSYTLLPLPRGQEQTILDQGSIRNAVLPQKILSTGRNTHAQLGLGFASQEATRGMVNSGFEGKGGIRSLSAGHSTSYILTKSSDQSVGEEGEEDHDGGGAQLYAFGNNTLGQLGLGGPTASTTGDPYDITPRSKSGEPELSLYPLPRKVEIGEDDRDWEILDVACGMDHTVILRRCRKGQRPDQVLTCGLNTDGQLGIESDPSLPPTLLSRNFVPVPTIELEEGDRLVKVSAGADTSYVLSENGRIWSWGNSEYGQAMLDQGVKDRVDLPTEVTSSYLEAIEEAEEGVEIKGKVVKIVSGGSWVALLDDQGRVLTSGYGPLGQGIDSSTTDLKYTVERIHHPVRPRAFSSLKLLRSLQSQGGSRSKVTDLHGGLDYIVAVSNPEEGGRKPRMFVWGLDDDQGRLGLSGGLTDGIVRSSSPYSRSVQRSVGKEEDPSSSFGKVERVYSPQEVEIELPKYERRLSGDEEGTERVGREEAMRIQDVSCGSDVLFVLVEDGQHPIGRWAECYDIDHSTDVVA